MSDSTPVPFGLAGTRAPVRAVAELSQLALGLEAKAIGTCCVEHDNCALQLDHGAIVLTVQGQRAAGQRSRHRRFHRSTSLIEGGRGCERLPGGGRVVARVERRESRSAIGPPGRCTKARRLRNGARGGHSALSLGAPAEQQPAARQQLEVLRTPPAGNERHGFASTRGDEQVRGGLGIPAFHARDREEDTGVHRDEALLEPTGQADGLLRRRDGKVHFTQLHCDESTIEEIPRQRLVIARESRALDRAVENLGRVVQPAPHDQRRRGRLDQHRQERSLPGRASNGQTAQAMRDCRLEAIQIRLGAGEIGDRVEPDRKLRIGHGVDQARRLVGMDLSVMDRLDERAGEGDHRYGGRGQWEVAQRPGDGQRPLAPSP